MKRHPGALAPHVRPARPCAWMLRTERWLLAHWPMPVEALASQMPAPLVLDTCDGSAWVGVVSLEITRQRRRRPWPSWGRGHHLPLLAVLTYVRVGGRPGVYGWSLDTSGAQAFQASLGLPCFQAQMACQRDGTGRTHYLSRRVDSAEQPATFASRYRPTSAPRAIEPGTLEHFATQRTDVYTQDPQGQLHHSTWSQPPQALQLAQAELQVCDMTQSLGFALPGEPRHLHYLHQHDTIVTRAAPMPGASLDQ